MRGTLQIQVRSTCNGWVTFSPWETLANTTFACYHAAQNYAQALESDTCVTRIVGLDGRVVR